MLQIIVRRKVLLISITVLTICLMVVILTLLQWPQYSSNLSNTKIRESVDPPSKYPKLYQYVEPQTSRSIPDKPTPDTGHRIAREAINNLNCNLFQGQSEAQDLGILILPQSAGASYVILDNTGSLFADDLPFVPNHARIGRRSDGSTIYGLASLRLNSKIFRSPETPEPVHIYQDGHLIYESNKIRDFDIAPNGSSFIVHEPVGGQTSRLIVRNIDLGTESHYDLGTKLNPINDYSSSHAMRYSSDYTEVMFKPAYGDSKGMGTYWFYPVESGRTQQIRIEDVASAILTSSSNGYFVDYLPGEEYDTQVNLWEVSRKEIKARTGKVESIWTREYPLERYNGSLKISNNGKWLAIKSWDFILLDTIRGDKLFEIRTVGHQDALLERLSNVLPRNATFRDIGSLNHIRFVDHALVFSRSRGEKAGCSIIINEPSDILKSRECQRNRRISGEYQNYLDVYNLENIEIDSSPDFRVETFPAETSCTEMKKGNGLSLKHGEVKYKPFTFDLGEI